MQQRTLDLSKLWRAFGVTALAAVMALGLAACGNEDDPETGVTTDATPVLGMQPESQGTAVPRPQDGSPAASVVVPTGTPDTGTGTDNEETDVSIDDDLDVSDTTISVGDSITWTNDGETAHTITSDDGGDWGTESIDEEIEPGDSFTHQFTTPGEYPLSIDDGEATFTVTVE